MTYLITDVLSMDEIVHLKGNVYAVSQSVADDYYKAMTNKLPCGYSWCDFGGIEDDTFKLEGWLKEGQASTGDVYGRVTRYENIRPHLIFDIIIDDSFKTKGIDQDILTWRSDPDNEENVTYDPKSKTARTKELIEYNTIDAFIEAPARRREAIRGYTKNEEIARQDLDVRVPTLEVLMMFIANYIHNLKSVVDVYELCARFGKTIFVLMCFSLSGRNTMVFTAYYQSAFGSIRNEVAKWHQFSDMRVVDARVPDAQNIYNGYRKRGYKVVIICGIHDSKDWETKYQWVADIEDKITIADEVDFGVHTKNVSAKVKFLQGKSYLLAMSGTGADKMRVHFDVRKHETYTMDQMLELKSFLQETPGYEDTVFENFIEKVKEIV